MKRLPWSVMLACAVAGGVLAADSSGAAQYFRSDRGVAGGGVGPLPDRFDRAENLCWRRPLEPGHSTPVVHEGKIFLTVHGGAELATVALDAKSGEVLWRRVAPTTRIEPHHQIGSPATATPACDGQRVYVFFGSYGLICYDLEGKQLWDLPMGPFQDEFGAGSSPIVVDDKVIVHQDHDVDSFIMAVDRYTGRQIWKTARPDAVRSYSTPAVWTRDGQKELLAAGALELASYDLNTGKKRWWINGLARIVIPIPVPADNMIYMASWSPGADSGARISLLSWQQAVEKWDANKDGKLTKPEIDDREVLSRFYRMDLDQTGLLDQGEWDRHSDVFKRAQNAILALKPNGTGNLTDSALVWKYQRGVPYVATPLVDHGMVWLVKDGGIITKLDAASGKILQEERAGGLGSYYASPVAGDGKVYFASEQGVLTVVANQREWNVISTHEFSEKIYATPVIQPQRIYIRTEKALYCFKKD